MTDACAFGQCAFGRQCVQGDGPMPAPLMLIGEAPGAYELKLGKPFVGRSGELLNELMREVGIARADVRIANRCGCVDMTREDKRPLPAELDACRPRLDLEIELTEPTVILLMGNTAISTFFPGERVGRIYNCVRAVHDVLVIPTYHPAASLRGNAQVRPVIRDALALAKRLCEGAL